MKLWHILYFINKDTQTIKVVTGIRRCGKSTLFDLYCDYLEANGVNEEQMIRFNLEDPDLYNQLLQIKLVLFDNSLTAFNPLFSTAA